MHLVSYKKLQHLNNFKWLIMLNKISHKKSNKDNNKDNQVKMINKINLLHVNVEDKDQLHKQSKEYKKSVKFVHN